jgi:glycosyltransferase involved in cell wall biosynthesis
VRVQQTLRDVLPRLGDPIDAQFVEMARFNRVEMGLAAPVPRVPGRGWFDLRWFLVRSAAARRLIGRELRDRRPDVVHVTSNDIALLLGDIQREVPCVVSVDVLLEDWLRMLAGVTTGEPTPAPLRPLIRAEHRALGAAPLVIAWTDTVKASIRATIPASNTVTLHPGIDIDRFRPARRDQRDHPGPLRVLFVGGRFRAKGGYELLDACAQLGRQVELHLVTTEDVPVREGVVVHRASAGSPELVRQFQLADVFCLPSKADAVPWVVLEAMGCGVPVVASDVGSIPELVPDECGHVVPPGDQSALVGALGDLLESPRRRAEMSGAARARVEHHYDAASNTIRLIDLLDDVIVGAGSPSVRSRSTRIGVA